MRAIWVVLTLLLTTLAGCASEPEAEAEPEIFQEVETTSDKGVIRGLVVDDSITPVEGATIKAKPGDLEATSDKDGAFVFTDLEPGVYFLTVTAPDHDKTQISVTVEAGVEKPEIARVLISYIPPAVPMWQELQYKFSTVGSVWAAGAGGVVLFDPTGAGHFANSFGIEANTTWFQSELIWTPQTPLSEHLRLYSGLNGEGMSAARTVAGPSPLLTVYDNEAITTSGPMTNGNTFYVGDGPISPVGVAVNQQATLFAHAFQNWMPPAEWRFSDDDGLRPPPA